MINAGLDTLQTEKQKGEGRGGGGKGGKRSPMKVERRILKVAGAPNFPPMKDYYLRFGKTTLVKGGGEGKKSFFVG